MAHPSELKLPFKSEMGQKVKRQHHLTAAAAAAPKKKSIRPKYLFRRPKRNGFGSKPEKVNKQKQEQRQTNK